MRIGPAKAAMQRLGIGIEQQLVGIKAVAARRIVGSVDPIAVERAGTRIGEVTVPNLVGAFGQRVAGDLADTCCIEQAQLDLCRIGREECKVYPLAVPGGAERIGQARPYPSSWHAVLSLTRTALEDYRCKRRQGQSDRVGAAVRRHVVRPNAPRIADVASAICL